MRAKPWEEENIANTVPTLKHKDDKVILVGMGNCLFSKQRVLPKPDKIHLERPGFLGDQGAMEFLDGMAGFLRALSGRFTGTVYWAGSSPRHLVNCYNNPEHHLPRSTIFKSTLHYVDLWNRFLNIHPKIRVRDNVSFVPFFELLGDKFYNKWLRDLVHLRPDINENFAKALANLPKKPLPLLDPLPSGDLSFTTWCMLQPVLRPTTQPAITVPAGPPLPSSPATQAPPASNHTITTTTTVTTTAVVTTTTAGAPTQRVNPIRASGTTRAITTTVSAGSSRPIASTGPTAGPSRPPGPTAGPSRPIPSIVINQAPANNNRPVGVVNSAISTMTTQERDQILQDMGMMEQD